MPCIEYEKEQATISQCNAKSSLGLENGIRVIAIKQMENMTTQVEIMTLIQVPLSADPSVE